MLGGLRKSQRAETFVFLPFSHPVPAYGVFLFLYSLIHGFRHILVGGVHDLQNPDGYRAGAEVNGQDVANLHIIGGAGNLAIDTDTAAIARFVGNSSPFNQS